MYFRLLRMQIQEEMRLRVSIWPRSRLLARFESIVRVQWRSRSVIQYRGWIFSFCRTMNTSGRATQVQQTGDLLQAHV